MRLLLWSAVNIFFLFCWFLLTESTSNISISLISWGTSTNWAMINDATLSLRATVARILTLLPDTCQPGLAIRINITLRPLTSLIWITLECIKWFVILIHVIMLNVFHWSNLICLSNSSENNMHECENIRIFTKDQQPRNLRIRYSSSALPIQNFINSHLAALSCT